MNIFCYIKSHFPIKITISHTKYLSFETVLLYFH